MKLMKLKCLIRRRIVYKEKFFEQKRTIHFKSQNEQNNRIASAAETFVQEKWDEKMKFWMKKYEDLFGITKLSELHSKVLDVQEKIQTVQENRRKIQEEIFIAQKKLQESQDILHKTSMGDDMYISLVTQVRDLLKEQRRLQELFKLYDQTEREHQMNLALAINSSQDHERTYREKNKYLSLITGVVGGLVGLLGSSINNWRHRKDIKLFANDISHQVSALQTEINSYFFNMPSEKNINENVVKKAKEITEELKIQQERLTENVKFLESLLTDKVIIDNEKSSNLQTVLPLKQIIYNLEENLDSKLKLHTSISVGLLSSLLVIGSLLFYISNSH